MENFGIAQILGYQRVWDFDESEPSTRSQVGEEKRKKEKKASFINFKTALIEETLIRLKSKTGFLAHCCLASGFGQGHGYDRQVM